MARRLILDTTVLIDYERGRLDRRKLDNDDLAIAALTVAEYRTGIELAATPEQAAERTRALAAILEVVEVLDYTTATALQHARLLAHTRTTGRRRGAHDLILAAHAAATKRTLMSRDARARFADLPGVTVLEP
ncbi:MAG TPA: type II toxin-antitoxin system VapC family toxin [Intrasporangiaceae bacterium]|nr:type II toxin-antitoxin system VapC family toxin [Intrasporangiaceae bacterium]